MLIEDIPSSISFYRIFVVVVSLKFVACQSLPEAFKSPLLATVYYFIDV
jgi:hypothetical protein